MPNDFLWEFISCSSFLVTKICSPPSVLARIRSLPSFKDASTEPRSAGKSKGITLAAEQISLAGFIPEPTEEINIGPRYPYPIILFPAEKFGQSLWLFFAWGKSYWTLKFDGIRRPSPDNCNHEGNWVPRPWSSGVGAFSISVFDGYLSSKGVPHRCRNEPLRRDFALLIFHHQLFQFIVAPSTRRARNSSSIAS